MTSVVLAETDENKNVIGLVDSYDKFITIVTNDLVKHFGFSPKIITDSDITSSIIEKSDSYEEGLYALSNKKSIEVIEKTLVVKKGFIFDTYNFHIEKLCKYEMVNCCIEHTQLVAVAEKFVTIDLNELLKGKLIYIIGKQKSGKTTLISDLLKNMEESGKYDMSSGAIISASEEKALHYKTLFPSTATHTGYDESMLESITKTQSNKSFIVFDDCFTSTQKTKSPALRMFILNCLMSGMTCIIASNIPFRFSHNIRSQMDYICYLQESNEYNRQHMYDYFCNDVCTYEEFMNGYEENTKNYGIIVVAQQEQRIFHIERKKIVYD